MYTHIMAEVRRGARPSREMDALIWATLGLMPKDPWYWSALSPEAILNAPDYTTCANPTKHWEALTQKRKDHYEKARIGGQDLCKVTPKGDAALAYIHPGSSYMMSGWGAIFYALQWEHDHP